MLPHQGHAVALEEPIAEFQALAEQRAAAELAPVVARLDTYQVPVAADTRAYMDAILNHPAFVAWRTDALAEPSAWDVPHYEEGETPVEVFHHL